ncbi:MAG: NAD-dependent epimerase/dehydratase family protein [Pseudomonadota bacterium]
MTPSTATKPVLITGAAGFVGFHCSRALLQYGRQVVGVDNLNDYYDPSLKLARVTELTNQPSFRFERLDLADTAAVAALFAAVEPSDVLHLAAQAGVRYSLDQPFAYTDSNVTGMLAVLEACRHHGVRHLLYASSSSVYGANTKLPLAEADAVDHPVSLYAATKRAGELMAHTYAHLFGLPTTGLRFFTVYGPWGRPDMAYFKFAKAIREGRPITVFAEGKLRRDFTYIGDVIEAIVRLLDRPPETGGRPDQPNTSQAPFRLFNIGNHRPVDVLTFVATLERCLGQQAQIDFLPMQPGDVEATFAAVDDLRALVDFAPRTSLEEGLAHFVAWFDAYYGYR